MINNHASAQRLDVAASNAAGNAMRTAAKLMVSKDRVRSAYVFLRTTQRHVEVLQSIADAVGTRRAAAAAAVNVALSEAQDLCERAQWRVDTANSDERADAVASTSATMIADGAAQAAADHYALDVEDVEDVVM